MATLRAPPLFCGKMEPLLGLEPNITEGSFFSFQYFQRDMPTKFETDPETVFNLAFSLKINQKKMKKLEKEYTTMKTKEKEDEIELRVSILEKKWRKKEETSFSVWTLR